MGASPRGAQPQGRPPWTGEAGPLARTGHKSSWKRLCHRAQMRFSDSGLSRKLTDFLPPSPRLLGDFDAERTSHGRQEGGGASPGPRAPSSLGILKDPVGVGGQESMGRFAGTPGFLKSEILPAAKTPPASPGTTFFRTDSLPFNHRWGTKEPRVPAPASAFWGLRTCLRPPFRDSSGTGSITWHH